MALRVATVHEMTRRSPDDRLRTAADCLSRIRGLRPDPMPVVLGWHDLPAASELITRRRDWSGLSWRRVSAAFRNCSSGRSCPPLFRITIYLSVKIRDFGEAYSFTPNKRFLYFLLDFILDFEVAVATSLFSIHPEMVDFDPDQGRSDFATAGVAGLRRGLQRARTPDRAERGILWMDAI